MEAIILDGHLKSALSAVRSLGERDISVIVGADRSTAMARHSKYATGSFTYPSPYTNPKNFVKAVLEVIKESTGTPVLYTFSDATHLLLEEQRDEFEKCAHIVFPSHTSFEIAFDKSKTMMLAGELEIPTMKEFSIKNAADFSYPVVVKPRHSVSFKENHGSFGTAEFIFDEAELKKRHKELQHMTGELPLIQDFIKGDEYGVEVLARGGDILASVIHKRLRSMSPTGGASVLKETIEKNEMTTKMETYSKKLIEKLSWSGPMMIEFKIDETDNVPKLMELNGRFWGSLPLAIAAGVDFPYLYYQLSRDEYEKNEIITGRSGVTTQHYLGDVRHLLRVMFSRDAMRKVLYPTRLMALKDFLALPRGTKQDVWSFQDMKPGIMEYIDVIKPRV